MLTAIKRNPVVRVLAIERHRLLRALRWYFGSAKFALTKTNVDLPYKVFDHKSVLLRKLGNTDMRLQHNKVTNLRLAAATMNNVLILPGETFSLWKLVGRPTAKRGFLPGMLLSNGEVIEGVGGGLCQIANLLYWTALHSPLTVTERYRHSYDVFPDSGRVLPFGSGATIFYNYIDLQFRNDTEITFQLKVWVEGDFLRGELRANQEQTESYSVIERNHRFLHDKAMNTYYRENVLFQRVTDKRTGNLINDKLICANHSELKYLPPADVKVVEV